MSDFVSKGLIGSKFAFKIFESLSDFVQQFSDLHINSMLHEDLTETLREPGPPVLVSVGHIARQGGIGHDHVLPAHVLVGRADDRIERPRISAVSWSLELIKVYGGGSEVHIVTSTGLEHEELWLSSE